LHPFAGGPANTPLSRAYGRAAYLGLEVSIIFATCVPWILLDIRADISLMSLIGSKPQEAGYYRLFCSEESIGFVTKSWICGLNHDSFGSIEPPHEHQDRHHDERIDEYRE
jgi:hypothetical protein